MSIRNLEHVVAPKSIAVIGASDREGSVGRVVMTNILSAGFAGSIWPVNPKYDHVGGLVCHPRIDAIDGIPDLAVILTPPQTVPGIISELAAKGTRAAVVITAGLNSSNGLKQAMLDPAKPHLFRIIGPNTVGLCIPPIGLNASFAHLSAEPGSVALLSQSGAIMTSLMDWAADARVGFSHIVSLGDMADVDAADFLDLLAGDAGTKAIVMYLESIPNPRKFISAARAAARLKPVVAIKAGRHPEAAKAAATHTGALSGGDRVVDAALARAGVLRIGDIGELFSAAGTIGRFAALDRAQSTIVTNGGGAGVLMVDELLDAGCAVAGISSATIATLDQSMPQNWSRANPIDIIGDAPPDRYRDALLAAAGDAATDIVIVMNCPTGLASPDEAARAVVDVSSAGKIGGKPVLACWLGGKAARAGRTILSEGGIANFETPTEVADAVSYLRDWSIGQKGLVRVSSSDGDDDDGVGTVNRQAALDIFRAVAAENRRILTEPEAKAVIAAYGIAVPQTVSVTSAEEVETAARRILETGSKVAVKLLSREISHKSDVGGVVLSLGSAEQARDAALAITQRVTALGKAGAIDGFTVQQMVERKAAHELILGVSQDPILGPVMLFGSGGVSVEVVKDTAIALPPLDAMLADDLISRTRIGSLLAGYRDQPPVDRAALLDSLQALSRLVVDFRCVVSLDINPLLADQNGAVALDARIEIDPDDVEAQAPNSRLAIRPVPSGWKRQFQQADRVFDLRPIRPDDAGLYPDFLAKVSAEDLRLRFLSPRRHFSDRMLIRLTQIDYDREMAFVALEKDTGALAAIGRIHSDPDHEVAEFGLLVRTDLQGLGLGWELLSQLRAFATADGLSRIEGVVLRENKKMLSMCREHGFTTESHPNDGRLAIVALDLKG